MRALILLGFLSLPAYADELQYSLTGIAFETQGPNVGTNSPFAASFEINGVWSGSEGSVGHRWKPDHMVRRFGNRRIRWLGPG
jgi:hypothetical protein